MAGVTRQLRGENEDENQPKPRPDSERWDCPLAIARAVRNALREMPRFQLDEQERCILQLIALDVATKKHGADPGDLELLKECQDEMRRRNMQTH
jgi:hypothetical protein